MAGDYELTLETVWNAYGRGYEAAQPEIAKLREALRIQHQHLAPNKKLPHWLCATCDIIAGEPKDA